MMAGGGKVLARTLDENRRSALHFAAALGKADLVRALVHEGADVDLGDKEGEQVPRRGSAFGPMVLGRHGCSCRPGV